MGALLWALIVCMLELFAVARAHAWGLQTFRGMIRRWPRARLARTSVATRMLVKKTTTGQLRSRKGRAWLRGSAAMSCSSGRPQQDNSDHAKGEHGCAAARLCTTLETGKKVVQHRKDKWRTRERAMRVARNGSPLPTCKERVRALWARVLTLRKISTRGRCIHTTRHTH